MSYKEAQTQLMNSHFARAGLEAWEAESKPFPARLTDTGG